MKDLCVSIGCKSKPWKARWYNPLTTNCPTTIHTQHPPNERPPWDWRILLNGKGDELSYERHRIVTGRVSLYRVENAFAHRRPRRERRSRFFKFDPKRSAENASGWRELLKPSK